LNYRNRALLNLAHKVQECQVRIPGVCTGYSVEGCEPAHSNASEHGRGFAYPSDDFCHAAACHPCHMVIDAGNKLSRAEKRGYLDTGKYRTEKIYWEREWIRVA